MKIDEQKKKELVAEYKKAAKLMEKVRNSPIVTEIVNNFNGGKPSKKGCEKFDRNYAFNWFLKWYEEDAESAVTRIFGLDCEYDIEVKLTKKK